MWRKVIDRENRGTSKTNEEFKRAKKRWKKRENTEGPKKENKWIEDEQKERVKRPSRRSRRERVALVEVKVKSFFFWKKAEVSKKANTNFQWKNEKFFVMKWKKQEVREKTVSFFFFQKKKETAKTEIVQKNVLFGMAGRYVKGENKWQKKDSQIKENLQKRDTFQKGQQKENQGKTKNQEREQKIRMSKKPRQWNCHAFTIKKFHDPNAKKSMSAACHKTRV